MTPRGLTDSEGGVTNHPTPPSMGVKSTSIHSKHSELKGHTRTKWNSRTAAAVGKWELLLTLRPQVGHCCPLPCHQQSFPPCWQKQTEVTFRSLRCNFPAFLLLVLTYHKYHYLFLSIKKRSNLVTFRSSFLSIAIFKDGGNHQVARMLLRWKSKGRRSSYTAVY